VAVVLFVLAVALPYLLRWAFFRFAFKLLRVITDDFFLWLAHMELLLKTCFYYRQASHPKLRLTLQAQLVNFVSQTEKYILPETDST